MIGIAQYLDLSEVFSQYDAFLGVQQQKPASLRWYGMGDYDVVQAAGHQQHDVFIQCSFNNEDCENVSTILQSTTQELGNCFHFITHHPVNRVSQQYGEMKSPNVENFPKSIQ